MRFAGQCAILIFIFQLSSGCATFRVDSEKYGTGCWEEDAGLLYYPPKPYLLITKNVSVAGIVPPKVPEEKKDGGGKEGGKGAKGPESGGQDLAPGVPDSGPFAKISIDKIIRPPQFAVQMIYLPDLSNPQRVHMRPGFGSTDTTFGFANGWQLNALNVKLNSEVPETIGALGQAMGAASSLVPTAAASESGISGLEAAIQALGLVLGAKTGQASMAESIQGLTDGLDPNVKNAFVSSTIDQSKAETELMKAVTELLTRLPEDLEPRIWLFEMTVSNEGKLKFTKADDDLFPFQFDDP